jgi:excinuclease ABC subunit C
VRADVVHDSLEISATSMARKTPTEFLASFDTTEVSTSPGCYIMRDAKDKPIYVGKAKNLRARIRNYINETDSRYSVQFLMRRVARIDFLLTTNNKEAVLLENSLIKQFKPRYNVQLKDDKTYISLRLDTRQDFPRTTVVRRYKRDGAKYFGPYDSAHSVRQTLRQLQKLFPLRTCSDHVMNNRSRPCLYYQLKQCCAPCVDYIARDAYHEIVNQVVMVLDGRSADLEKYLLDRIEVAAEKLDFEFAAVLRDRLHMLRRTLERQRTVDVPGAEDRDVFGLYTEGAITEIQVLFYRGGKMLGGRDFSFRRREMPLEELLSSFMLQYYAKAPKIPREVLVPIPLDDGVTLSEILADERGAPVTFHCPQRGEKKALTELAGRNAQKSFEEKKHAAAAHQDTLVALQQALGLAALPTRIECFDISTIQGTNTVASMVTFENGVAEKSRYRRYTIKHEAGQDDFSSMREVLMRRFTRAVSEKDLPDFVLIDGGKGQLGVAHAVFKDLGIEDLAVAGIAKARTQKEGGRTSERLFVPGRMNAIVLAQRGVVVQLLARIRDEAHRFAITFHRKRRQKATISTTLTQIPGIGEKRAKALLREIGSLTRIREASVEAITKVPGFNRALAEIVHEAVRKG